MDTTGVKSASNSNMKGMAVGRLRLVMASSDKPERQGFPHETVRGHDHQVPSATGANCTLSYGMILQLYTRNTGIPIHLTL